MDERTADIFCLSASGDLNATGEASPRPEAALSADPRADVGDQSDFIRRLIEERDALRMQLEAAQLTTQQALRATQQALRARDEFMSLISHELRTPLNAFKLEFYTRRHYLASGSLHEFSAEKIQRMIDFDERQLDRLLRLINDTLDISRIQEGLLRTRPSRINLRELLQNVIEQMSAPLTAAKCEIKFTCMSDVIGYWDEFRIEQAFINLLLNASRYGAGKVIEVTVEPVATGVRVSIRDFGAGIAADDQVKIFQQFERPRAERRGSGLGAGLFITDRIVRAHRGSLYVCSSVNEGSIFSVILPIGDPQEVSH